MGKENQLAVATFMQSDAVTEKLEKILGKNAQSFVSSALQAVASNKLLVDATKESIYGGVMAAAVMNLQIDSNIGHAYLVPYKNKKTGITEAQLQIGYKGFVQLAIRTNQFATINATEIYENQFIERDVLSGAIKINNVEPEGKIVGYVAYFKLLSGFEKFLYMTRAETQKHAKKYSQSFKKNYGVWADGEDGFNSMAKKTVLKLLLNRYAPLSFEMKKAVSSDQAIITDDSVIYPDNDQSALGVVPVSRGTLDESHNDWEAVISDIKKTGKSVEEYRSWYTISEETEELLNSLTK